MLDKLRISNGKWFVNGALQSCWVGRTSFKLCNMLSKFFAGMDGQKWLTLSEQWVEHNQKLLGENHTERVLAETTGWEGSPMFGAEPKDAGIWDLEDLQKRSAEGRRIKELTDINKKVIEWLMKTSHETGVAFEYVVDATLKHTPGLGTEGNEWLKTAISDHAIRQTSEYMRELWLTKYPNVKIVINARNEWTAHNRMRTKLHEVNMWGNRFYRWERVVNGEKEIKLAFEEPRGDGWGCRQWPEGYIIVDPTWDGVNVGPEPGNFKMALDHPERHPTEYKWWEIPPEYEELRADARGMPCGYNESILYGDVEDESRLREWYGARGWTTDLDHYLIWLANCKDTVDYFIIHDEKGMQCDVNWPRPITRLEEALGGTPPPPPPPQKISYRRVVTQAYREIFNREPDAGGLEHHNKRMRDGVTESELREGFIRSKEFESKNKE